MNASLLPLWEIQLLNRKHNSQPALRWSHCQVKDTLTSPQHYSGQLARLCRKIRHRWGVAQLSSRWSENLQNRLKRLIHAPYLCRCRCVVSVAGLFVSVASRRDRRRASSGDLWWMISRGRPAQQLLAKKAALTSSYFALLAEVEGHRPSRERRLPE